MLVCASNLFSSREYSNLFIVATFSNKSFSGKTSWLFKNSHLLTYLDDKVEVLGLVYLNHIELCFV